MTQPSDTAKIDAFAALRKIIDSVPTLAKERVEHMAAEYAPLSTIDVVALFSILLHAKQKNLNFWEELTTILSVVQQIKAGTFTEAMQ